jgi:hypothetical protein
MNNFKFRAECKSDANLVIDSILEDIACNVKYEREYGFPDYEVEFSADTDLISLKNMIMLFKDEGDDLHTILDTINYQNKYTGEITYEN